MNKTQPAAEKLDSIKSWLCAKCMIWDKKKLFFIYCGSKYTAKNIFFIIQRLNKIIFLTPLKNIFTCLKQKLTKFEKIFSKDKTKYFKSFYVSSKCILIPEFVDIYTRKQNKNTKEENNFLQCRITSNL